jgi:LmbE family N-acetylglucosaminyl deacetylase
MSEQESRVAMVVVAHPDDAEFMCGGTMAAWARDGWDVYLVVCTDAAAGGSDFATEVGPEARRQITETRHAEQLAAAKVLGLRGVEFLDLPDGQLQPTLELRRELVRLMRQYRPTRLMCQSPERTWFPQMSIGRYHPDHLAAGQATLAAVYPASQNPWDFPELLAEGYQPHKVREIYVSGTPNDNHVIDISETLDTKIEALRAHVSQLAENFDNVEKWVRQWATERGEQHNVGAAEIFHLTTNG